MRQPPRILIADDNAINVDILRTRLVAHGYEIVTASDGEAALSAVRVREPDLVLLDVMMPKLDGIEVCRRLKADRSLSFTPVILVTARADSNDVVAGLDAGADEYLTKPVDQAALVARVKSMLRIKALHDTVQEQTGLLERQADDLRKLNVTLEDRVAAQVAELERMARLKRFLPPQLAQLLVSSGDDTALETQRREVTVVFCDLGGFTAFAETTEPEEVMSVLREFHGEVGRLIFEHEGTLETLAGDGVVVVFNAPLPCTDPCGRAVRMAVTIRDRVVKLLAGWRRRGHELDVGIGLAQGYATLGTIGFEARSEYVAFGRVSILAGGLCQEARGGQILVNQRAYTAVEHLVEADPPEERELRRFRRPVTVYNVRGLRA
jgi:DNA-binding response OmpR family regulator